MWDPHNIALQQDSQNSWVIWQIMSECNCPWDEKKCCYWSRLLKIATGPWLWGRSKLPLVVDQLRKGWFSKDLIIRMRGRDFSHNGSNNVQCDWWAVTRYADVIEQWTQPFPVCEVGWKLVWSLVSISPTSPVHLFACWGYEGREPFSITH